MKSLIGMCVSFFIVSCGNEFSRQESSAKDIIGPGSSTSECSVNQVLSFHTSIESKIRKATDKNLCAGYTVDSSDKHGLGSGCIFFSDNCKKASAPFSRSLEIPYGGVTREDSFWQERVDQSEFPHPIGSIRYKGQTVALFDGNDSIFVFCNFSEKSCDLNLGGDRPAITFKK